MPCSFMVAIVAAPGRLSGRVVHTGDRRDRTAARIPRCQYRAKARRAARQARATSPRSPWIPSRAVPVVLAVPSPQVRACRCREDGQVPLKPSPGPDQDFLRTDRGSLGRRTGSPVRAVPREVDDRRGDPMDEGCQLAVPRSRDTARPAAKCRTRVWCRPTGVVASGPWAATGPAVQRGRRPGSSSGAVVFVFVDQALQHVDPLYRRLGEVRLDQRQPGGPDVVVAGPGCGAAARCWSGGGTRSAPGATGGHSR